LVVAGGDELGEGQRITGGVVEHPAGLADDVVAAHHPFRDASRRLPRDQLAATTHARDCVRATRDSPSVPPPQPPRRPRTPSSRAPTWTHPLPARHPSRNRTSSRQRAGGRPNAAGGFGGPVGARCPVPESAAFGERGVVRLPRVESERG